MTMQPTNESRVQNLLAQMTLAEKIGQMTQPEKNSVTPAQVTEYALGSVLSGGGGNPSPNNPQNWRKMVGDFQAAALNTRLGIPIFYGTDAVHGHNNMVGATIFPHNIGLGAAADAQLVEKIGAATAREMLAVHANWDFAPAVSVPHDLRWGRTYEGYSRDTALVGHLATHYVRGLLSVGNGVLPSVKHFVGDGGTTAGSRIESPWLNEASNWQSPQDWLIDQGDTRIDEETLRAVHLAPYKEAIAAGALNVMASFSSWNGVRMHDNHYLLTDVLKGEMGFRGFVVSDWMAIDQITASYHECVVRSINAGVDMVMVPYDFKRFIETLTAAVEQGDISIERIDDAVSRILLAKFEHGLFEQPYGDESLLETVGSAEHRAIAREAARKSCVLLKNEGVLPLAGSVFVAGDGADDIGLACGGWTIEWQGGRGKITEGHTLLDGLKRILGGSVRYAANGDFGGERAAVGVVVLSEEPYAEGIGDVHTLNIQPEQIALIEKVRPQVEKLVVVLYSGRPLIMSNFEDHCDAIVAAWLPGSEADGVAELLVGQVDFSGKLPQPWPENDAWQIGYGL